MAMKRKHKLRWQLLALALVALIVGVLAYPKEGQILQLVGIDNADLSVRRGLDLQGGVYLVYEADVSENKNPEEALRQAAAVIERRVNPGGASEAIVQIAQNNRIVVQLPDVDDPQAAIERIGQTAQLQFFVFNAQTENLEQRLQPTQISGEDVAQAEAVFDQFNRPIVTLEFKPGESTAQFAQLTRRIYNSGTQLLTLLDGQPVFGPATVQQPILSGETQLSGGFETIAQAQETATLLNAGALPVPVELVAQQTIGPTLGAESLRASVVAAVIGFLSVAIFMVVNYRLGGLLAVLSIAFYSAATLAVFKLSALPLFGGYTIVLTLAGIAGFIMSIAVAADANILVLERLREEKKTGLKPIQAVESGYNHAWSSIRDASVATLIITVVLYYLASRFGEASIQGFALVLGVGVVLNLVNVAAVSRTLLRGVAWSRWGKRL